MSNQDVRNAAMQQIKLIRARLTVLEKIVQEPEQEGSWLPREGDNIWIFVDGKPVNFRWYGSNTDNRLRSEGAIFPTREAAEKAAPLFARAHKFVQAALTVDPDAGEWTPWRRWCVVRDGDGKWVEDYWSNGQYSDAHCAHVNTKAQAQKMAAILNAEGV